MRFEGWVVTTNDREPDQWEIFHSNGHLMLATSFEELSQIIIDEREINAGEGDPASNWSPETWRAVHTVTGQEISYNAGTKQFMDVHTKHSFGPTIQL